MTNAPGANWLSERRLQGVQHASWRLCRALRHVFRQVSSVTTVGRRFVGSVRTENREREFRAGVSSYNTRRGSMPSFFIREIRVVRGIPKRCAAPVAPATRPFVAFRIRTMSSRSLASRVPLRGIALAPWVSSSNGTCSAEPRVKMTERSIMFSSSRMFPGQLQAASFLIAGAGIVWMALFIRRLYFCVKYRTRRGMSSGRSRKGGMRMGNTLSR